jgi:serine/threonine-protein kinase
MPDYDAPTQDHPSPASCSTTAPAPDSFVPDHRVIAGSGSQMASETRDLLQQRLRAASLVLVAGFGLFFVRAMCLHRLESLIVAFHALLLGFLILSLALLSSSWRPTLRELRIFEVVLFAIVIIFFMAAEYGLMLRAVREGDPLLLRAAAKSSFLWILALVFTYAIFIPNTWRRAAQVIVPMAVAPIVVPWVLGLFHPEMYEVAIRAANLEQVSEHGLFLLLGAFTAIFGTHTINALRTEAFTARLLNQYRLGRRLGGGGMGEVFLAEHQLLKRPCAIKLIRHERAGDSHALARFEREVRATAQLSHWNTIEIFDYGRNDDGTFYYVMEYLPGLSLNVLVRRYGPLPPARVIYLLRQACDALHEAHEAGLIHRDIKPANLFAADRGGRHDVTKLLDFGLVKTLRGQDEVQLSREDTVAGSPLYMAPELVVHSQPPDRRTDIYSLGAVAYFLLTGRPPFLGASAMEVMIAQTRDPVVPPSELRGGIPPDLEEVVLRCLAKKPSDRYPDALSLAAALDACADAANWSSKHAAEWWRTHPNALAPETDSAEPSAREGVSPQDQSGESAPATARNPVAAPRWM